MRLNKNSTNQTGTSTLRELYPVKLGRRHEPPQPTGTSTRATTTNATNYMLKKKKRERKEKKERSAILEAAIARGSLLAGTE
jgi:hypothetical protein